MAEKGNGNATGRNGLPTIQTRPNGICHDDSSAPVKANTIDELHSLQKKKSAPTTPLNGVGGAAFSFFTEEERQQQQLQSIRYYEKSKDFVEIVRLKISRLTLKPEPCVYIYINTKTRRR